MGDGMTKRDKIYKTALKEVKNLEKNLLNCDDYDCRDSLRHDEYQAIANLAFKKASKIKDGPSEKDRFIFEVMSESFERKVVKLSDKDILWLMSKLKQAWGIE